MAQAEPLTLDDQMIIIELLKELPSAVVAEKFDIPVNSFRQKLCRLGISPNRIKQEHRIEQLKSLSGVMTFPEMARATGISLDFIRSNGPANGILSRDSHKTNKRFLN